MSGIDENATDDILIETRRCDNLTFDRSYENRPVNQQFADRLWREVFFHLFDYFRRVVLGGKYSPHVIAGKKKPAMGSAGW